MEPRQFFHFLMYEPSTVMVHTNEVNETMGVVLYVRCFFLL